MLHEVRVPVANGAQRQQPQCETPLVRKIQPATVARLPGHAPPQRRRRHARRSMAIATAAAAATSTTAASTTTSTTATTTAAAATAIAAERGHALAHHVVES